MRCDLSGDGRHGPEDPRGHFGRVPARADLIGVIALIRWCRQVPGDVFVQLVERILHPATSQKPGTLGDEVFTLKEEERQLIINALLKSKGNKSLAAQMLGISRKSLYKKMDDYGIRPD